MRIHDVTAECKSLGFTCRYDATVGEFKLARPLSAYAVNHRTACEMREREAYYTTDGLDCMDTAREWHRLIHGTKRERSVA